MFIQQKIEERYPNLEDVSQDDYDKMLLSIDPGYVDKLQSYRDRDNVISQQLDEIYQEIRSTQDPGRITIDKVDGDWVVYGGYYLDFDNSSYFQQLFPEEEVEATASFDEGYKGDRFYIIKSQLLD